MGNQLDELVGPVSEEGLDVNVIHKQLKIEVGVGSLIFEILLWVLIIPGLVFLFMKIRARDYLSKLQQRIQHNASQIDNYLEQRVVVLQNVVGLVEKSTTLDKEVMTTVAALRGGGRVTNDEERNLVAEQVESSYSRINLAFEAYPELKSHAIIADALQQNSYLQREITAAREVYNDTVRQWNQDIYTWPTKRIVAARAGYTTRIPFATSREVKEQARATFF
ncbi:MAG: LemA family protein [Acholeplasmataceae bacterium]|jgi:LemA protein|nr:LemA family protein [Acholeplasmataceae bacterium]